MAGFTPGPWSIGPAHVVRHQFRDTQDRRVTEWIAECVGEHPPGEIEANAQLITAAPELIALAIEFRDYARSGAQFYYPLGSLQKLDELIARALGHD